MSNIDLHNHVIPPTIVDAIARDPERFGTKIDDASFTTSLAHIEWFRRRLAKGGV